MAYFSIPRVAVIGEVLLNGSVADTNDGTKVTYTGTNVTYSDCPVGYQKQCGVFGATSNLTRASLASVQGFMAFIRPTANTNDLFIYNTGTAKLAIDASNNLTQTGLTNSTIYVNGQASAALTLNAWNFILVTHDSITAANWNFGASSFIGNAAAIRTFNAKPSSDDILRFWHEFNRKLGGGSDFGAYVPAPIQSLQFSGGAFDVATQNAVTVSNATLTSDIFGISNEAYAFNGTNAYMLVNNARTQADYAVEAFLKWDTVAANKQVVITNGGGNNTQAICLNASSQISQQYWTGAPSYLSSTFVPTAGVWYHVLSTRTGTTGKIFVDGVEYASGTVTNQLNTEAWSIGAQQVYSQNYFDGDIAYINIYGTGLDVNQSKFLNATARNKKAYSFRRSIPSSLSNGLLFRGGAFNGSTMYDETGNGRNFTGTATKRKAGQLDVGSFSSQLLTLTRSAALENANGTASIWFKTSENAAAHTIFGTNNTINTDTYGFTSWMSAGVVTSEVCSASTYYRVAAPGTWNDGKLHRLTLTWDGSNVRQYIDGALMGTAAQSTAIAYNSQDFKIGGDSTSGSRYFAGFLAYPTLWNRALNSYEVMMDRYSTYVQ